jgi:methylenetetrahydrofolate dehydrogenase (NADP+)/methenyltetrahydrofolate cyclohydrolase
MAKLLSGTELVGYIKERQARQVRALRQASHVFPRLVIIKSTTASPVIDAYIRMKQRYGEDILIETIVETLDEAAMPEVIRHYNEDPLTHGIIIQLPLADATDTEMIVNAVAGRKDVDGLAKDTQFDGATATAIHWLVAAYGIELAQKTIAIVGNGRLVGAPLAKMWRNSGYDVTVLDSTHADIASVLKQSDIIVTATGTPRLITSDMVPVGAAVIDAGTASEGGVIIGDVDPAVRLRDDIKITPEKGGVGPLTVVALFDNVIRAAQQEALKNKSGDS